MTELTREQQIAAGILIDMTEIMQPMGVLWPIAVHEDVERWIQSTTGVLGNPAEVTRSNIEVMDNVITAAMVAIMLDALKRLHTDETLDPNASEIRWSYEASWKDDTRAELVMRIEPDEMGKPCFTIDLA